MKKLKESIIELLGSQKDNIKKYSVTFSLMAFITLFMVAFGFDLDNIEEFYTTLALTNILVFVCETFFRSWKHKIISYIVSFGFGLITKEIIYSDVITTKISLLLIAIYLSIILYTIYKIFKNTKESLSTYLSRIFNNVVMLFVASLVLEVGVLLIYFIIDGLFDLDSEDLLINLEIILLGLFITPGFIISFIDTKREVIKPIRILLCYIILPIFNIVEIIIYVYLFSVIVTKNIPSNMLFSLLAWIIILNIFVLLMLDDFTNSNYVNFNNKYLSYSFIPLILLQTYSLGIRICDYGLTLSRTFGIYIILFETAIVFLIIYKNRKYLNYIFYTSIVIIVLTMVVPFMNVVDLSYISQLHRLKQVYKEDTNFDTLSIEDKEKASNAYYYLLNDDEGKKHIPNYVDEKKMIYSYENNYYDQYKTVYYFDTVSKLNVENYNTVKKVDYYVSDYDSLMNINSIEFNEIYLDDQTINEKIDIAIRKMIKDSINVGDLTNNVIYVTDDIEFIIESLDIYYNKYNYEIRSLSISGYLLY